MDFSIVLFLRKPSSRLPPLPCSLRSLRKERDSVTNISWAVAQKISRPRLAVSRVRETALCLSHPHGSRAVGFLLFLVRCAHCGRRGIRTLGALTSTPHFECGTFDLSAILPFMVFLKITQNDTLEIWKSRPRPAQPFP